MKNIVTNCLLIFGATVLLTSCMKDKCTRTYTWYEPVYKTSAEVRANIRSNQPRLVERPGKLSILGKYIFLNEVDRGIHIIDNTNPASPKNVAFIDIPGNVDVAVKGNTLYADAYTDLVTLDITNPLQVSVKKFVDDAFPYRRYSNGFVADTSKIIVDWVRKDTTVTIDCDREEGWFLGNCSRCAFSLEAASGGVKSSSPYGAGISGSMARFTIMNNYLYTVTDSKLNVFDISAVNDPQFINKVDIGWNIETIYPFKDRLFIGSNTGMFIFSTTNPGSPNMVSQFAHARTCDPVIAEDKYAFVTLRSGTTCQGFTNQLDILNIENLSSPFLVKTYQLTNPHGLSKDGNTLFICDGKDGLKIYNAENINDLRLIKQVTNLETYDVIAFNDVALVVAKDGLYQFSYSNLNDIKLLSRIGYKQ
ncbi:MAG TPA: hypothetical protein VGD17_20485 [Chitinophagaceae bacterium]